MPVSQSSEISEAIRLARENQPEKSCQTLRTFLRGAPGNVEALLWLAKFTPDNREALAAAELALAIDPENEIAKRAVAAVTVRAGAAEPAITVEVMRITGMTLAQAFAVVWPFNGFNRPIGVLLEETKISPRDLAWAAENANEARIRNAARTILLSRLLGPQLKEPPPPMKVIRAWHSYSERQERLRLLVAGLVGGAVAMLWVLTMIFSVANIGLGLARSPYTPALTVISCVLLVILCGPGYLSIKVFDQLENEGEQFRKGADGEKRVVDLLRVSLPAPWTLIQSMEFPERRWGDIDLVLVGPGGLWAIEVKAYTGPIRNTGDRWQYKGRWGWRNVSKKPGKQARQSAMNLKGYLETHGVDNVKWVQPLIIWAGENDALTLEDPQTPVWKLSEIDDHLEEFWQGRQIPEAQIQQCVAVLNEAIELVKKRDEDKEKKKEKKG